MDLPLRCPRTYLPALFIALTTAEDADLLVVMQDFVQNKSGYLQTQVGNPDGADKPNKKVRITPRLRLAKHIDRMTNVLVYNTSTTTPACGYARARRRSLSASRKPTPTLATPVSFLVSLLLPTFSRGDHPPFHSDRL